MKKFILVITSIIAIGTVLTTGTTTQAKSKEDNKNQSLLRVAPKTKYSESEYDSSEEALEAIQTILKADGVPVDLGNNIIGYSQGGAGSMYVTFHKGVYGVSISSSNFLGQDSRSLSKQVAQILANTEKFPDTVKGRIDADFRSGVMSITWADENLVKSVSSEDLKAAIDKANTK